MSIKSVSTILSTDETSHKSIPDSESTDFEKISIKSADIIPSTDDFEKTSTKITSALIPADNILFKLEPNDISYKSKNF